MAAGANDDMTRWTMWRAIGWGGAALLLLAPFVAMQFTREVQWTGFDFLFAACLIGSVGLAFEFLLRRSGDIAYRCGAALAVLLCFLLVWVNGAVGIIGSEGNPANLMYGAVLLIAVGGMIATGFAARGMAWTMVAAALAQLAVGTVALIARLGATAPGWPLDILGATGGFALLWLLAAALFRKAMAASPRV